MLLKTSRKTRGRVVTSRDLVDEFVAKEMSRRQMVLGAMAASLAACTTTTIKEEPSSPGDQKPADDSKPAGGSHLVGIGYDESDRDAALQAALKETIGL